MLVQSYCRKPCFSPSDCLLLHPFCLSFPPPFIETCTAVAELHIERKHGLTSWSRESHLNRCSSWADTRAAPRESVLLLQQHREASGSSQLCDKLRFLIFHPADLFLTPLHRCPSAPYHPHPHHSATPPLCFPSPPILQSGRPIAEVMREVNWPCCVFRRLQGDNGCRSRGGDNFFNFHLMASSLPSAVFT